MTCSDEHLGEYLAYGWEGGEKGYDFAADERERIRFSQELEHVLATGSPPAEWLTPSGERGAAAIGGIIHNNSRVLESGIVFNSGVIPNLPVEAAVEVPVMTDADGIHPISLGPLPEPIAKLLMSECAATRGRGCGPCFERNRPAGIVDRSGREFGRSGRAHPR